MVTLDTSDKVAKALKDIQFRMNSMMAYDIYLFLSNKFKQENEKTGLASIYDQSHLVDPAYEISVVFGRQLLDFLQIAHNKKSDQLDDPLAFKNIKSDDLFLSSFPGINVRPLADPLVKTYERQIKSIIKVANKASAHMTFSYTTGPEFADVSEVKPIIHELCMKYVPNIPSHNLWWMTKDKMKNAYMLK